MTLRDDNETIGLFEPLNPTVEMRSCEKSKGVSCLALQICKTKVDLYKNKRPLLVLQGFDQSKLRNLDLLRLRRTCLSFSAFRRKTSFC